MDQLFRVLQTYPSLQSTFSFYDVVINFILALVLTLPFVLVYKKFHKGPGYSSGFVESLLLLTVTTAIIMMIIGSDIARAFSLVGALSIIRFRTAVKESKNTGYIFASLAIGMATGTGMYAVAIAFSLMMTLLMIAINKFPIGKKPNDDQLLFIDFAGTSEISKEIEDALKNHCHTFSMVQSEHLPQGQSLLGYIIQSSQQEQLQTALTAIQGVSKVSLNFNDQRIHF